MAKKLWPAYKVYPAGKDQEKVIENLFKELKLTFEKTREPNLYNPEFVKKILKSKKDIKEGRYTLIKTEDLWK